MHEAAAYGRFLTPRYLIVATSTAILAPDPAQRRVQWWWYRTCARGPERLPKVTGGELGFVTALPSGGASGPVGVTVATAANAPPWQQGGHPAGHWEAAQYRGTGAARPLEASSPRPATSCALPEQSGRFPVDATCVARVNWSIKKGPWSPGVQQEQFKIRSLDRRHRSGTSSNCFK